MRKQRAASTQNHPKTVRPETHSAHANLYSGWQAKSNEDEDYRSWAFSKRLSNKGHRKDRDGRSHPSFKIDLRTHTAEHSLFRLKTQKTDRTL